MKIDKSYIEKIFKKCGVSQGDNLFLHCDAIVTASIEGIDFTQKANTLFDGIIEVLGPDGTLILPTFTYSATNGEVYNVQKTTSKVGLLTEHFRNRIGVKRSCNPIFSVAAFGKNAEKYALSSFVDCFGDATCFDLLLKQNSWIFTLGCSFDRITFIHYVDQIAGVNHRFFKTFPAKVINNNFLNYYDIRYYVRDLERQTITKLDKLKERLDKKEKLHKAEFGRFLLTGVTANDFYKEALAMIKEKPNIHIEEGYAI